MDPFRKIGGEVEIFIPMLLQIEGDPQFEHSTVKVVRKPEFREFFRQQIGEPILPGEENSFFEDHHMVADQSVFPARTNVGAAPGNAFDDPVLLQGGDRVLHQQKRRPHLRGDIPCPGEFRSGRKSAGFDPVQQKFPHL